METWRIGPEVCAQAQPHQARHRTCQAGRPNIIPQPTGTRPLLQYLERSAGDQRVRVQQFIGWQVVEHLPGSNGKLVSLGRVNKVEIVAPAATVQSDQHATGPNPHTQEAPVSALLCVRCKGILPEAPGWRGVLVHRIPLVPQLLPWVNPASTLLFAALPKGFKDLGHRNMLVGYLETALRPLAEQKSKALYGHTLLPTLPSQAELVASGQEGLCSLLKQAGGPATVATQLGWQGARKPPGYWEELSNVEAELQTFVANSWVEMPGASGSPRSRYWFNQVSGRTSMTAPDPWSWAVADRVMPTLDILRLAHRQDLINAVVKHGGFRAVAGALDLQAASDRASSPQLAANLTLLGKEVAALVEELQLPSDTMPTAQQITDAGRMDLLRAVRLRGGIAVVAGELQRRSTRRARGVTGTLDSAAQLMVEYMQACKLGVKMPTAKELGAVKRWDLVHAVQRHGRGQLRDRCMQLLEASTVQG